MAEEIDVENGRNSNFEGLVTLTLTFDPAIRHIVLQQSSTSTYIPNFIQIEETFCGRTDVRTDGRTDIFPLYIIRSTFGSRPKNYYKTEICNTIAVAKMIKTSIQKTLSYSNAKNQKCQESKHRLCVYVRSYGSILVYKYKPCPKTWLALFTSLASKSAGIISRLQSVTRGEYCRQYATHGIQSKLFNWISSWLNNRHHNLYYAGQYI